MERADTRLFKNDLLEKTNEEGSVRNCGPGRFRRGRASTCRRSPPRAPYPYTKAPAYVAPIYNWTGFYIGGHLGGAFGSGHGFAGTVNTGNDGQFLGGIQAGADYQFASSWVVGIEGQYSWLGGSTQSATFTGTGTLRL